MDTLVLIIVIIILVGAIINYNADVKTGTNIMVVGIIGLLLVMSGLVSANTFNFISKKELFKIFHH